MPLILLTAVAAVYLILGLNRGDVGRVFGGMRVTPPAGYRCTLSDDRYAVWKYEGSGMRPGTLILDARIRNVNADMPATVEQVLSGSGWLAEAELYVNPQGIRMVRGYAPDYAGAPERRYYVESRGSVFLMSMIEDERYHSPADCERVMQETADSIRVQGGR